MQASLANEKLEFDIVRSDGGVFEVSLEGRPIFSKKAEKRFPRYQEVPNKIVEVAATM